MGIIELTIQLILAAVITNKIAKRVAKILPLIIAVLATVLCCWILGILYVIALVPAEIREPFLASTIGTGFWFSLGGAIYGAYKGRSIVPEHSHGQNFRE